MNSQNSPRNDDVALTALLTQYKMLSDEVRMYMKEIMKIPVLTVLILAFIFGIGGTDGLSSFSHLLGVPVLAGLIFYLTFLYYCVIKLGRYRALVEEELNELAGKVVMRWNSQITKELEWFKFPKKRRIKILGIIFNPIYLFGIFGCFLVIAVIILLLTGRLTPSEILGPFSVHIFASLLILALLSFVYVATLGRYKIEKRINKIRTGVTETNGQ